MDSNELTENLQCECGEIRGEYCPGHSPESDMITLRYLHLRERATHRNLGGGPIDRHKLAREYRVTRKCADDIVDHEPEWTEIVGAEVVEPSAPATDPENATVIANVERQNETLQVLQLGDLYFLRRKNGGWGGAYEGPQGSMPRYLGEVEILSRAEAMRLVIQSRSA